MEADQAGACVRPVAPLAIHTVHDSLANIRSRSNCNDTPGDASAVAQVEIVSEQEMGAGWRFIARVLDDRGSLRTHEITLSYADYNHWSSAGADPPAAVAEAALRFLLSRIPPDELRSAFDASIARRMFPDADAGIPPYIIDVV